ncbi:unnamed protein product, partial [Mesorhabditis belari]|uniref:M02D8-5-like third CUB domain-containing protein n=1 Tax=Mesorhabditis belari TaxID=2138241 RepID=A0AAF3FLW8_9BILA
MIVYSFQSNPQQLLNMTGIRANESSVTTTLLSGIKEIGDFKTYYYRNELTLSYSFTFVEDTDDDPYADYYYYIVISAYNDTNTPAFDQCQNVGAFDMSKTSIIDFSAQDVNSTFGYHKNSNCKWVFENPPFNHQLMISFYHFVTEKCCDVITVGGANLAFPSHSGSDIPWLVYGVSNRMEVVFQSDSLEEYTYMVGQARAINCTCPQSSITLTVNQTASISYGWVAKFPFCSPMACNSTITFDRDSILQFDVQYSASMNSNLVVTDSTKDRFITGSLSDTTSHDWLQVSFSNSLVTDLYKMWDSTGYSVSVKALPLKIQQIDIDLCSQEFIVLMGETLTYKYDTAIYRLDGSNCTGSQITSTFLSMSDGYLLDVYDGELANGALAMTSFNGPANFTFTSNFATIRLIKTNDLYRPGFRVIVAANPQISVYSPTNDCSKQNLFSVPLIGNGNDIKILYRGTTPFPGDYLGLYGMDLVFPSAALPIEIYQGTTLDNNNKIYGGDSLCDPITTKSALPSFIFGEFVVIKLVSKVVDPSASVFFRCQQQVDANLTLAMNSPVPGLLIAPQYTDIDYSPDPQTYSFIIQYLDVKDFQGIALTFLNPIPGDSNLTISYTENGNLTTQRLINESTVCYVEIPTWAVSLSYQWFCRTSPFELVNNCQRPLLIKFEPIFSPTTQQSKVANDWRQILLLALVVSYFSCD